MIPQLVVEVDVRAAWRVEARQQLADDDKQLQVRWFLDEAPLDLVFVLLGRLPGLEHVLRVRVELVALVAVLGLARDGVVVRLVRRDDAAVAAEVRVLKEPEVVARVVDRRRHEDRRAPVVVEARLEREVLDDGEVAGVRADGGDVLDEGATGVVSKDRFAAAGALVLGASTALLAAENPFAREARLLRESQAAQTSNPFANAFAAQPVVPSQFSVKPILNLGFRGDDFVTISRREYEELLESKQHLERTLGIIEHLEARCGQNERNLLVCTETYRKELARTNTECEAKCADVMARLKQYEMACVEANKVMEKEMLSLRAKHANEIAVMTRTDAMRTRELECYHTVECTA